MKVCVIQNKNGIIMIVSVSVKKLMFGVLEKMMTCGIMVCVIASVIKDVKLTNI